MSLQYALSHFLFYFVTMCLDGKGLRRHRRHNVQKCPAGVIRLASPHLRPPSGLWNLSMYPYPKPILSHEQQPNLTSKHLLKDAVKIKRKIQQNFQQRCNKTFLLWKLKCRILTVCCSLASFNYLNTLTCMNDFCLVIFEHIFTIT